MICKHELEGIIYIAKQIETIYSWGVKDMAEFDADASSHSSSNVELRVRQKIFLLIHTNK